MIEYRLIELFDTLPPIEFGNKEWKPNYDFGTEQDKNHFLEAKRKEKVPFYPLIWLITPITPVGVKEKEVTLTFIIATLNTNVSMSNRIRVEQAFNPFILPVKENLLKALRRSGFTKIVNKDIKETAYFNYGENGKHNQTDIWDALKVEVSITFNNCVMQNINY